MEEIRRTLGGLPVSVAVDVRYDTPGKLFDKEHWHEKIFILQIKLGCTPR